MSRLYSLFPTLSLVRERYIALSPRERLLLSLAMWLFILLGLWWLLIQPSLQYREANTRDWNAMERGVSWMREHVDDARRQAGLGGANRSDRELSVVSRSAKLQNVSIKRLQPDSDRITVELSRQLADDVFRWLSILEREHAFVVENFRMDRVGTGLIDMRLTLG